ncbi:MAG: glucose-1-phosphate adenylyltransferase [Treponema sp.]|jgi:glucose-1-phosphate adenylyltransferase|nr:glucose-1-phosphate adenylyltransferase [Treponema sp.]
MSKIISIILGGGKGTRLYPLTLVRSKPAVPFGGKYRIVDIPVSNCINSGYNQIYLLTQFNSASLHMHINNSYIFDRFSQGFVEILAAEQTPERSSWYEGTADAVRKNAIHFRNQKPTHYIILSGDQLYRMDLREFVKNHIESKAEISIATTAVNREAASGFGIMKVDKKGRITQFMEKPALEMDIADWKIPANLITQDTPDKEYLASMGIYIFDARVMDEALDNGYTDFGKEIIPHEIAKRQVQSFMHRGYWEDIGTIKSFYDANIDLAAINPAFDFYDEMRPIYTSQPNLPPSKLNNAEIVQSITSEGCIVNNAKIQHSVIGVRTVIESGSQVDGIVCMGADYYEKPEERQNNIPPLGIGQNCRIAKAIIDKNARIGDNCTIGMKPAYENAETNEYKIVDGIIVIKKDAVIPANTAI